MTHAEARELLEIAATEPDGLDRLGAGDTAESGQLAGHLAGCDACREEYGRLTRTARLLRSNLTVLPPPDLRERTLARVAVEGRVRTPSGAATAAAASAAAPWAVESGPSPAREPVGAAAPRADRSPWRTRRQAVAWLGSLAAAMLISVGLSWALIGRPLADQAQRDQAVASGLSELTAATVAIDGRPDARHVTLSSSGGALASLAFSPSSRELVVTSTGLAAPNAGDVYRCWVETNGQRTQLGEMRFLGSVAAWYGWSDAIAQVPDGSRFGVSLVPAGAAEGQPVLAGTLTGS